MASAEQLLNEAQYAFANISFGESLANTRHAARAKSLCRKIIRKFPTTMEAHEAHAILRRLGEEAYTSEMPTLHRHVSRSPQRKPPQAVTIPRAAREPGGSAGTLDWGGLLGLLLGLPKTIAFALVAAGFVLFSMFGWLILLPLLALVLFTGPFRSLLQPAQRSQLNDLVASINSFIDERRGTGGFS